MRATRKRKGDGADEVNELDVLLRGLDQLHGDPYRQTMTVRRRGHRLLAQPAPFSNPFRGGDCNAWQQITNALRPIRARSRHRAHPTRSATHGCWRFSVPPLTSTAPFPPSCPLLSSSRPRSLSGANPTSSSPVLSLPPPHSPLAPPPPPPSSTQTTQACTATEHKSSRRNCALNPNCLQGFGKTSKDGIWATTPRVLSRLGDDPNDEERDGSKPVGLRNLGATCYMNAMLQVGREGGSERARGAKRERERDDEPRPYEYSAQCVRGV